MSDPGGGPRGAGAVRQGTSVEFRLPDIGEGLGEGEIVAWRVDVGDRVARDQVIAEVQTDKSVVELPSPAAGVVTELGGNPGDVLPVGAVLMVLTTEAPAEAGAPAAEPAEPVEAPVAERVEAPVAEAAHSAGTARRVLASPATRKLALQLGVDLAGVRGSGPGGRVTKEDVEAVAAAAAPEATAPEATAPEATEAAPVTQPQDVEVVPLRGLRRRIAQTMTQSWRQIPHITDFRELDATELVRARSLLRDRLGPELTYLPLFVAAAAAALRRHPALNASLDLEAETITYHRRCHVGIATATDDGLIVPVLHDADRKSLVEIGRELSTLAQAARSRTISPGQASGGTFTITNIGSYGAWLGTPIIRPPEAAIAGFGRIRDAVVPVGGVPAVRPVLPMVVAADHRLVDGDVLGGFAGDLAALLADPVLLLA